MKKLFSILLSLTILFSSILYTDIDSYALTEPTITSEYAITIDYDTGEVLYEKNGYKKVYPASTTKVLTAYVVLKHVDDLNSVVEIQEFKEPVEGSSMYLKAGEKFTVKELLTALMVKSANDVAVTLATYVSGNIEDFAKLMNEEAKLLGAKDSNFVNPHGLHDENHYTTPYDMSIISRAAMEYDIFRELVKTKEISFPSSEFSFIARYFENTNAFLNERSPHYYKAVDGLKTGTTDAAGKCLVSTATVNGRRVISGVFASTEEALYVDSKAILNHGLYRFKSQTILTKDDYVKTMNIDLSKQKELTYMPKSNYTDVLSVDESAKDYKFVEELTNTNYPIKTGDTVGSLKIYDGDELKTEIPLIAQNDVDGVLNNIIPNLNSTMTKVILTLIIILLSLIVLLIVRTIILSKSNKRKNRSIFSSSSQNSRTTKKRSKRNTSRSKYTFHDKLK